MNLARNDATGHFPHQREGISAPVQVHVSSIGQVGHGKTTLASAITRVLASASQENTYMTVEQINNPH